MVPKKSRFCPKVPNFAFVASFRAKSQIPNPVSERLIMLLGTIKPHASPVNCIKCTVSEHIAHTVYRVIVPPQKELFILEKLHFTSSIAQFCNFVIFGYKQKLELLATP